MGHYLDETMQQRQLIWTALQERDVYETTAQHSEADIDQLSSVRLVLSTCSLSQAKRTRSDPVEVDLEANATAKEEAGAFANTRLSHTLTCVCGFSSYYTSPKF